MYNVDARLWIMYVDHSLSLNVLIFFLECEQGTYKSTAANEECKLCPSNSVSTEKGLTECECLAGYYRAAGESASTSCTRKFPKINDS